MKTKWIAGAALAAVWVLLLASAAMAGGLTVSGGKIDAVVSAASDQLYTMSVQNTSDAPMDIGVEVKGYGTSGESAFTALEPADDTLLYTGRDLLTVSPDNFHLDPGSSAILTVSATIPSDIKEGGRYAIVLIHTVPSKAAMVATISAVAARVLFTIQGSTLTHDSEVTSVDMREDGQLEALVSVTNNGNHHYKPHIRGILKQGSEVVAAAMVDDGWPMIPGYGRQFKLPFVSAGQVLPNTYSMDIEITDDSGNLVARQTSSVQVKATYSPPSSTKPISQSSSPVTAIPVVTPFVDPSSLSVTVPAAQSNWVRTNWLAIAGAAAGAVILALGMYLFGVRRGRGH